MYFYYALRRNGFCPVFSCRSALPTTDLSNPFAFSVPCPSVHPISRPSATLSSTRSSISFVPARKRSKTQQSADRTPRNEWRARANMSSFRELSPRVPYILYSASLSLSRFFSVYSIDLHLFWTVSLSRYIFSYLSFSILLLPSYNRNARRVHVPFLQEERSINETKGNARKGDEDVDKGRRRRRRAGKRSETFLSSSPRRRRRETITPRMLRRGLVWLSTCGGAEAASNLIMETACCKGRARDIQLVSTGCCESTLDDY